jgi:hypothetical protein
MPPAHRRALHSVRGSARRRLIWAEFDAVATFTANGQWFNLDLLQTFKAATGADVAKVTVMRTRGYIAHTAGVAAAGDRIWTGLRVSDLDDVAVAPTTVVQIPNPRDNPYVAWRYFSRHSVDGASFMTPGQVGLEAGANSQASVTFDIKSRAKLANVQETWAFTLLQDNVTNVASSYHVFFRTLLALA